MPALYDTIGKRYADFRRPDPRIAACLMAALGDARAIVSNAGLARLRRDLDDGTWMRRNGHLLGLTERDLGYRIVIGTRKP